MAKKRERLADRLKRDSVADDLIAARLRAENRSLQQKYKLALKEIETANARADLLADLKVGPSLKKLKTLTKGKDAQSTAVIVMSDWHVEETVEGDTVDGLNTFNLEIAERRIKRAFEKAVYLLDFVRHIADIDTIVLAVLGDLISGFIHEELVQNNSLSPTEATLFAQDQLHSGINHLLGSAGVSQLWIPTCHGNHGRTTPKKLVSVGYKNSYEFAMYNQLARYYKSEPRVTWKIEKGIHNWLEVQGRHVRFHHGDYIRYAGGVGGVTIPANKKLNEWNKARRSDCDFFGHYHTFIDNWRWAMTGCLCGYNAYAQSVGAEFQEPSQLFAVIDRRHNKVLAMPIFVE